MRFWKLMLAIIVLVLTTGGAACATDQENEVIALVENAAATFQVKGKDHTLKLINSLDGGFRKGPIYVFAVAMDGHLRGHPANRKLVGRQLIKLKGAKGKEFIRAFIETARNPGSGWVDYWWQRHGVKGPTLKRSYVVKVPNYDMLVGAGYYVETPAVAKKP